MTAPLRLDPASLIALRDGSIDALDAARLADALRVKPGERSWRTRAGIERQHKLIRELALTFYSGSRNHRAECIHRDLARYEGTTWQRRRADAECRRVGARQRLFWHILKARDRVPGVRYLNHILSDLPAP
ncbi:hypothetical protein ACVWXO_008876 [Bradyrhizobium sp. LM2.7]